MDTVITVLGYLTLTLFTIKIIGFIVLYVISAGLDGEK